MIGNKRRTIPQKNLTMVPTVSNHLHLKQTVRNWAEKNKAKSPCPSYFCAHSAGPRISAKPIAHFKPQLSARGNRAY